MLSLYQIFVLILILSVCQQQIGRWIFLLFRLTCQYNFIFFCLSNLDNVIFIPSRLSHKIFPLEAAGQPSEPVWCLVICIPCIYCHQWETPENSPFVSSMFIKKIKYLSIMSTIFVFVYDNLCTRGSPLLFIVLCVWIVRTVLFCRLYFFCSSAFGSWF